MPEIIDLAVSDEFRTKKRNLIWLGSTSIVLAMTDILQGGKATVPTLDLTINVGLVAALLFVGVAYSYWGFIEESKIIIRRHSKASEKHEYISFNERYKAIGEGLEFAIASAKSAAAGELPLMNQQSEERLAWIEGQKDFQSFLGQHMGWIEEFRGQIHPPNKQPPDEMLREWWKYAELSRNLIISENNFIMFANRKVSNLETAFDGLRGVSDRVTELGKNLDQLSELIDKKQIRFHRLHDVISGHIIALAGMAAALSVIARVAI